jgi:hypothetical protein
MPEVEVLSASDDTLANWLDIIISEYGADGALTDDVAVLVESAKRLRTGRKAELAISTLNFPIALQVFFEAQVEGMGDRQDGDEAAMYSAIVAAIEHYSALIKDMSPMVTVHTLMETWEDGWPRNPDGTDADLPF